MATLFLTIGLIGIFFVFMSVRLLFIKNGEFRGTCASQNVGLANQGITCACGKEAGTCAEAQK